MKIYFFDVDVQYPEKLQDVHNYLTFLPERLKLEKAESLLLKCMARLNMLFK